jgi:hypothetical protein
MDSEADRFAFEAVIDALGHDFARNPLQYGNEDLLIPELVHRLRQRIDPEYLPVEYRQEYPTIDDQWRTREFHDRVEDTGKAARVRPEVLFVEEGDRWQYERDIRGETTRTTPKFDLVVFSSETPLIAQSKEEGPGNYWDTENELSILCEIKHSKNESSNFYSQTQGADDVHALAHYPGEVDRRVFLFLDWWPVDGHGRQRYQRHHERLSDEVGALPTPVDIIYIPRHGDIRRTTLGE